MAETVGGKVFVAKSHLCQCASARRRPAKANRGLTARDLAIGSRSVSKKNATKSSWRSILSVRATPAGKGVFAKRQFRKGQAVGEMTGKLIADDDYDPDYVVDMGDLGVLEPNAPFRFLNHCCEPNCELVEWETEGDDAPQLWVQALRTVRDTDQLTIDYGWPAEAAIPCLCGSAQCRGWVVDAEQVEKAKRLARRARK